MYHNFCTHSFVDGHLNYFHILAVVNSDSVNFGVYVSFRITVFSRGIGPVVGLLGHGGVLFLVFKAISILLSLVAGLIYIPTSYEKGFPFLHKW